MKALKITKASKYEIAKIVAYLRGRLTIIESSIQDPLARMQATQVRLSKLFILLHKVSIFAYLSHFYFIFFSTGCFA